MSQTVARASEWVYHGIWKVLVQCFRVPSEPPKLPAQSNEAIRSYRPADGFLKYLKFQFWILLTVIDLGLLVLWGIVFIVSPIAGVIITPIALAIIIIPDVIAYVAVHLRYDTTWYVISDRSLRIRRGIWIIHETTITYENIQNVIVDQGPLQRWFGIADVVVKTAGGGGGGHEQSAAMMGGHHGLIEGIANAAEVRDLIMNRLRHSKVAGLGDEVDLAHGRASKVALSPQHLAVLREIRDILQPSLNAPL